MRILLCFVYIIYLKFTLICTVVLLVLDLICYKIHVGFLASLRLVKVLRFSVFSVVIAVGSHPISSRTRKLSPPAPMVLHGFPCGRVGRRRICFCLYESRVFFLFFLRMPTYMKFVDYWGLRAMFFSFYFERLPDGFSR